MPSEAYQQREQAASELCRTSNNLQREPHAKQIRGITDLRNQRPHALMNRSSTFTEEGDSLLCTSLRRTLKVRIGLRTGMLSPYLEQG
jgi:hypothetical protein